MKAKTITLIWSYPLRKLKYRIKSNLQVSFALLLPPRLIVGPEINSA